MIISKADFCIAAGICGISFIGYCIYFDRKRRNDPNFKNKLKERRKARIMEDRLVRTIERPDLYHKGVMQFFIREVELGEGLMAEGHLTASIEHFCIVAYVCSSEQQMELFNLLKHLAPRIFPILLQRLPITSRAIAQKEPTLMLDEKEKYEYEWEAFLINNTQHTIITNVVTLYQ